MYISPSLFSYIFCKLSGKNDETTGQYRYKVGENEVEREGKRTKYIRDFKMENIKKKSRENR